MTPFETLESSTEAGRLEYHTHLEVLEVVLLSDALRKYLLLRERRSEAPITDLRALTTLVEENALAGEPMDMVFVAGQSDTDLQNAAWALTDYQIKQPVSGWSLPVSSRRITIKSAFAHLGDMEEQFTTQLQVNRMYAGIDREFDHL